MALRASLSHLPWRQSEERSFVALSSSFSRLDGEPGLPSTHCMFCTEETAAYTESDLKTSKVGRFRPRSFVHLCLMGVF